MTTSILLIDDDAELCALMQEFFGSHGFELEYQNDGSRGLGRALEKAFDLILLDVMLPRLDGFEVLRQVRRRSPVPVIMLTARTEHADRIAGLDAGADDYLPKPFSPEELLARIRAVLRRIGNTQGSRVDTLVEVNGVRLDRSTRQVWLDDLTIEVTSLEYDILEVLVRSAGRVVSRDELATVLYQREATPFERAIDVHVSHLRKKLETGRTLIKTVRGIGYQFCPSSLQETHG